MGTVLSKNRLDELFSSEKEELLAVYYTAGYPALEDTLPILQSLEESGADIVEVGMPYSDPLADGPTIQASSLKALQNGMSIDRLFQQLADMRQSVSIPVVLMGYFNPVLQYGIEAFCQKCQGVGIDALILPDLPVWEYREKYKALFESYGLYNIFLISPQTPEERIRQIDDNTHGFIYMVSSASITGAKKEVSPEQLAYFERIKGMGLKHPRLIGFGISSRQTFLEACSHARGAIIGSAFIQALDQAEDLKGSIKTFISDIKGQ